MCRIDPKHFHRFEPIGTICDSVTTQTILVAALLYFDFNEAKPLGVVDLKSEAEIILQPW